MRYPPVDSPPGNAAKIYNGEAARALDAMGLDRATCRLACWKPNQPASIAQRFVDNGQAYEIRADIPRFTEHVMVGFLATGRGHIDITCTDDTWDARILVEGPSQGLVADHAILTAAAIVTAGPLGTVSSHTIDRDITIDFQDDESGDLEFTFEVNDESGSSSLVLYAIKLYPVWPDEQQALPT